MKTLAFLIVASALLVATPAFPQMTGGNGTGIGAGPPGALPNGGLDTNGLPSSAGTRGQSGVGLGANPATAPDNFPNASGRPAGDGLITGSGATSR
jgi:hypothetical protein